jgi:hypothetical protein
VPRIEHWTLSQHLEIQATMKRLSFQFQIKLHGSLVTVASFNKVEQEQQGEKNNAYSMESPYDHKRSPFPLQNDPSKKFRRTIKIESFISIGVLIAAAFLTIISPPSISLQESMSAQSSLGERESQQDYIPSLGSFTLLAIRLSVAVIFGSIIYFKKSKQQVRNTIAYFKRKR